MRALTFLPVSRWFTDTSSFMVSVIVHMVVVILLAFFPLTAKRDEQILLVEFVPNSNASEHFLAPSQFEMTPALPLEAVRAGAVAMQSQPVSQMEKPQLEVPLELHPFTLPNTRHDLVGPVQFQDAMRPIPLNRDAGREIPVQTPPTTRHSADLKNDPYIEVVRRFIQYDIGQLSGAEGVKARLDFSALGEDAIPALVWGLNQSAYLNQSCPVIVIQSKLNEELSASGDPNRFATR